MHVLSFVYIYLAKITLIKIIHMCKLYIKGTGDILYPRWRYRGTLGRDFKVTWQRLWLREEGRIRNNIAFHDTWVQST